MNDKTSRILLICAAFLSGLLLFFGAILFITGLAPIGSAVAAVGGPFHLEDQSGKVVTQRDLNGQPFLVFFGYTHCPDVCPTTLFDMSQVMKKLGPDADRINALFITVDPERDTPELMKDYMSNFDPRLRGLTGDQAAINTALKEYRLYAKKIPLKDGDYTMDHTAIVYLMDKNGDFVARFDLSKQSPDAAATDLRKYM